MSKGKTFRVRIPVAVGLLKSGEVSWSAAGWPNQTDAKGSAIDSLDPEVGAYEVHWVEADRIAETLTSEAAIESGEATP